MLKKKFREYKRVIKISSKPSLEEYSKIIKITGLGILLIGFTGIFIQFLFQLLRLF